jgi:hypothetical protein
MDAWKLCWSCVSAWQNVPTTTLAGADFKTNIITVWKRRCHENFNRSAAAKMTFFLNPTLWGSSVNEAGVVVFAAQKFFDENGMGSIDLGVDRAGRRLGVFTQTFDAFKSALQALAKQQMALYASPPAAAQPAADAAAPRIVSALWSTVKRFDKEAGGGHAPNDANGELAMFVRQRSYHVAHNVLDYYAELELKFPTIARLSRRYLCIPSSNVASESLWSLAGGASEDERSCTSAELLETQLMIRRNYQECANAKLALGLQ